MNWTCSYSPEMLNSSQNWLFFIPCDLEIWRTALKHNRAPLLCHLKLCASFRSHWSIQMEVTFQKHLIRVKIDKFLFRVTLKFVRWPWITIGHLLIATSSFVHHFIVNGQLKLRVTVQKRQIRVKMGKFLPSVTLKFDGWRWKTTGHQSYATSSSVHHFIEICEFKLELQSENGYIGFWPVWPWLFTSDLDLLHGYHFCHWL